METSPGLDGSRVFMNNKDALTVTVDHPKGWEPIPYKGGKVKSTADPSKDVITEQYFNNLICHCLFKVFRYSFLFIVVIVILILLKTTF